MSARAIQYSFGESPKVEVAGIGLVYVPPGEAEDLAALVGYLADATLEQHRELAAAIRQAAAIITGATGGQS